MQVTKLIENIGKCRDLIKEGDYKKIIANIYLFEKVYNSVKIQLDKYIKNPNHELDFTYMDLMELSDEISEFIRLFPAKFKAQKFIDKICKNKKIDNAVLNSFNAEICDKFYIDTKLRECQKILAYCSFTQWLWNENNKQSESDFTVEITNAIRSFL